MTLVFLVIAILAGYFGQRSATAFENKTGHRAWGLPAVAWAVIFFGSLLVGGVLFAIATRGTKLDKSDTTAVFVTGFRPLWLVRSLLIAVCAIAVLAGVLAAVGGGSGTAPVIGVAVVGLAGLVPLVRWHPGTAREAGVNTSVVDGGVATKRRDPHQSLRASSHCPRCGVSVPDSDTRCPGCRLRVRPLRAPAQLARG